MTRVLCLQASVAMAAAAAAAAAAAMDASLGGVGGVGGGGGGAGLADFQCPACGRRFARHWHLKRHLATHLTVKPFKCPYCPHAANIKNNLKLHIRKIHPGEALPEERTRQDV